MAKKSKIIEAAPSREEAQAQMQRYAEASAEKRRLEALKDQEMNKVREKYQARIEAQDQAIQASFERMYAWAEANRDSEFRTRKSQEWPFGVIGYLAHPPKAAPKKGFTWAAVVQLLKDRNLHRYIRRTESEEAARDVMLSDREDPAAVSELEACGVEFRQDEQFYIKPKEDTAS
jgi:phage host-nuclease inhibitor protein Gam